MSKQTKAPVSKQTKLIILVIVVLLLAGGAAYHFKQKAAKEKAEEKQQKEAPKEPAATNPGSMADPMQKKADETTVKKQMEVLKNKDKPA